MASKKSILLLVALVAAAYACGTGQSACNSACYNPADYVCATDSVTSKSALCPISHPASCNGACYSTSSYSCVNNALAPKVAVNVAASTTKAATSTTKAATSTTKAATSTTKATTQAAATTAAAVVVTPTPAPVSYPTQTADLRIINSCKSTLWFEGRYGASGAPIPGQTVTATQALSGGYVDYTVPSTGLSGSRFWAKYGCDTTGKNCLVGDQMQYWPNPPGGCPADGCTPPVDSLFEATWGCKPGASCNSANPTTWFDTSQVDGYTIPYKLTANGATNGCDCSGSTCGFSGVNATNLTLEHCPTTENLSNNGEYASVTSSGSTVSLTSVDLRMIDTATNQVIGCMSPCKRLNWAAPYGLGQSESTGSTLWMCCPTPAPSNCLTSAGCVTPDECRAGPIATTQYVSTVHTYAPGVYSYSYDDGVGLHACPAGTVTYTMEFCPNGATYPLQL